MTRPAGTGRRELGTPGFTVLELLVALAVLTIGLVTIFGTLAATKDQVLRTDVLITGRLLAQCILDGAQHRFHVGDARFFRLDTPPDEVFQRALEGAWRQPFLALRQARTGVMTPSGQGNPYFDATGPRLPSGPEAVAEMRFWEEFSYEVRVDFDVVLTAGSGAVPLDSDGDGKHEIDMARLEVEVFHGTRDASVPDRSVCTVTTLLVAQDKTPGTSVLSTLNGSGVGP